MKTFLSILISLITAPVEPAPIEPEVETFRDTAEVTEVKTEGTFYTNKLYSHQLLLLILFSVMILFLRYLSPCYLRFLFVSLNQRYDHIALCVCLLYCNLLL